MSPGNVSWNKTISPWPAVALAYIAAADWLFYRRPVGWTIGLYAVLLLTVTILRMGTTRRLTLPAIVIASGVFLLSLAMVVEPGVWGILLASVGLITLGLIGRQGWRPDTGTWIRRWVRFLVKSCRQPFHDARVVRHWGRLHRISRWAWLTFLRNWRVPVLLSSVFVVLFAIANPVVARWLRDFWELVKDIPEFPRPGRIVLWVLAGTAFWALVRVRVKDRPRRAAGAIARPETGTDEIPTLIVRCLVLFNAVFAVENLLDIYYLWGGATLPDGITYAQYAHRGAYPLVATALLAAAFVLIAFRPEGRTQQSLWARRLVYAWIAQNVFLTGSSLWRLGLYVEIYSLSRWRIAAGMWMLLVASGLVWIGCRIVLRRSNAWLVNMNALTTVAMLFVCAFIDFDGHISWYNVRHCREVRKEGVTIDLEYLRHLGPEALPGVEWLGRALGESPKGDEAREVAAELRDNLCRKLTDWRGWTLRRHDLLLSVPSSDEPALAEGG